MVVKFPFIYTHVAQLAGISLCCSSVHCDPFAVLLHDRIPPRFMLLQIFCTLETKKSLVWYAGDRLGQPLPDLFRPTILVPLKATQADSNRANAKK